MDIPKFGPLADAKAQAAAAGFTIIYDNRYKGAQPLNPTGATRLDAWPGLEGKNGGGYEYAFDGMKLIARPTLPHCHGLNMRPKDAKETLDVMRQAVEMQKDVGPTVEFLLTGAAVNRLAEQ